MIFKGESSYIAVCRMADGKVCERHYRARGHKAAVKLAVADGAEAVLSIEREDAEDIALRKKIGLRKKLVLPVILALLASIVGIAIFWLRRGCPKFW